VAVVYVDGSIVPESEARVSALDRGLLSGYGLFETMRAYGGKPWAFDDHYARTQQGAELIDLSVPAPEILRRAIADVVEANALPDGGVRYTITGGAGPADPQADPDAPPSLIITAWPLRDYASLYEEGASLATIAEGGRPLSGVKTTSYAVSVAGRIFAKRAGADDALFLGGHKRVLEATGSNLFIVEGTRMRTPRIDDAILPGVTRRYVIEVARQEGFEVIEDTLYLDDLRAADEVVLTSSLREVYPVRSVDGHELARAGHAERLREAYSAFVRRTLGI
jgi:branched-subunit amino acid aminotransferase/4-amino-4-deoxychorismate lyase